MFVSKMLFEIKLNDAFSLKDRRKVERSIKEKLKNRFNISIVIQHEDYPMNLFTINIVQINENVNELKKVYENMLELILDDYEIELLKHEFDILD
ncbi:MAG: DUF503 family protein [Bacillota bacterium]|nr:DUF503 family protein [Bacillota bacterium]